MHRGTREREPYEQEQEQGRQAATPYQQAFFLSPQSAYL
jgi:hypothetical protein